MRKRYTACVGTGCLHRTCRHRMPTTPAVCLGQLTLAGGYTSCSVSCFPTAPVFLRSRRPCVRSSSWPAPRAAGAKGHRTRNGSLSTRERHLPYIKLTSKLTSKWGALFGRIPAFLESNRRREAPRIVFQILHILHIYPTRVSKK